MIESLLGSFVHGVTSSSLNCSFVLQVVEMKLFLLESSGGLSFRQLLSKLLSFGSLGSQGFSFDSCLSSSFLTLQLSFATEFSFSDLPQHLSVVHKDRRRDVIELIGGSLENTVLDVAGRVLTSVKVLACA